MQTETRQQPPESPQPGARPSQAGRRRFSPLMLVGLIITLVIAAGAGTYTFINRNVGTHAAATNPDCSLIVPQNPLTAQGLATPYQLVATNPNNGPCNEANPMQAAFVQGAVIDPRTGQISVYNPLVVDKGTQPAAPPVVPTLPPGAVVALWFGYNGNNLTLQADANSLNQGRCVNGINGSIFGQFAYCNAPAFFQVANQAINQRKLVPPQLGIAKDGQPCPTVRDFSVVDQDQSDNVTTTYIVVGNQIAQMNAANLAKLQNTTTATNGSDNRLVAVALDGALGCTPWKAPDLADPGQMATALPLNELLAAARQAQPVALVPNFDPMVTVNNNRNLNKLNAYRAGVDQPQEFNPFLSRTSVYCANLAKIAPERLALDAPLTSARPSPDPAAANNLYNFLGQRFAATWTNLNCQRLTGKPSPVTVQTDGNGVAIKTMINQVVVPGSVPIQCAVNKTVIPNCTGTTTINGQACSVAFDINANKLDIDCPADGQKVAQKAQDQTKEAQKAQPPDPDKVPEPKKVKNQ